MNICSKCVGPRVKVNLHGLFFFVMLRMRKTRKKVIFRMSNTYLERCLSVKTKLTKHNNAKLALQLKVGKKGQKTHSPSSQWVTCQCLQPLTVITQNPVLLSYKNFVQRHAQY